MKSSLIKLLIALIMLSGLFFLGNTIIPTSSNTKQLCIYSKSYLDPAWRNLDSLQTGNEASISALYTQRNDRCFASNEFSKTPKIKQVADRHWKVSGNFKHAGQNNPRTPDCGGGSVDIPIKGLKKGHYKVESNSVTLEFDIPSDKNLICARAQ